MTDSFIFVAILAAAIHAGCSSGKGSSGTGGAGGSGGATGAAGATGTAGRGGTAGSAGMSGASGAGGTTGAAGGGASGAGGSAIARRTVCGATTCDSATQDCCVSGTWEEVCGAKGSCTSGTLSCSSAESCSAGQVCCAMRETSGRPTAACATAPCPTFQLCASAAECPSGLPCSGEIYPGSPQVCDKCATVRCGFEQLCCPSTGACCPAGSGSCCIGG